MFWIHLPTICKIIEQPFKLTHEIENTNYPPQYMLEANFRLILLKVASEPFLL